MAALQFLHTRKVSPQVANESFVSQISKASEENSKAVIPREARNPSVFTAKIKRDPLRKIGAL
jgi:hypothetical protein